MRKSWGGIVLAAIGVLAVVGELVLHVAGAISPKFNYEINELVLGVSVLFGFVGFWMIDPKQTKEGGAVLVEWGAKFIPKFGRRSTDAVAIPKVETTTTAQSIPSVLVVGDDFEKDETVERPKFAPGGA